MKVWLKENILIIATEDLPPFKKGGSVVRNNYFWALKAIACYARKEQNWEFDPEVWPALARMIAFFAQSGYLGFSETILEFPLGEIIPEVLRPISTWQ